MPKKFQCNDAVLGRLSERNIADARAGGDEQGGVILYCSRISITPAAMAAVSTPKIALFAIV
jgi:hypothetical protein